MPGERTEQATQHRREKARKEGDLLHSRELSAAAGMLAGVMALGLLGREGPMESWRSGFAAFLDLGTPRTWEPGRPSSRRLSAMRRSHRWSVLAPVGV